MVSEILAGPAMELAFELLLGSVKKTIAKAMICKNKLKKINAALEALSPLIKQIKECNLVLDRPESELESFVIAMNEGKKLVDECSKIKNWEFWKKSSYTTKLVKLDKSLNNLLKILQVQQARDGKETLALVRNIHDRVASTKKAISVGVKGSSTESEVEGKKKKIPPPAFAVGLDAPLERLKKKLLWEDRTVLVLTAPGGSGKTTLAKMLCSDNQIEEKFSTNIFFVKVSKTPNLNFIVQQLYEDKRWKVPFLRDEEDAVIHLERFLRSFGENPILLVLDDVWSGSESLIEKFNLQIPEYMVLVTSRFAFPRFGSRYDLERLNAEDAITLFRHHAFLEDGSSNKIPDDLVNKVVEHCKKVPLALKMIGSSLRNTPRLIWEREVKKWSKGTSILSYEAELLTCLQSSLNVLDQKDVILKECFMDLGSFPEDRKIQSTTLIDLWTELYELEEDDVIAYLLYLTYYNLANFEGTRISMGEEDNDYSKIFVTQHDMLRELAIHQSAQESEQRRKRLIVDLSGENLPNWWKKKNEQPFNARLVSIATGGLLSLEWCDIKLPEAEALVLNFQTKNHDLPEFVKSMSKLKVLIVTNYDIYPAKLRNFQLLGSLTNLKRIRLERIVVPSLGETHVKLENLKKLSLVRCKINRTIELLEVLPNLVEINIEYCMDLMLLPDGLCDLINLRKISIIRSQMYSLPEEIGRLVNLEVLRLSGCHSLSKLPDSICRLSKLTFLDISFCSNIQKLPEHIGDLRSLKKFYMGCCIRLLELPRSVSHLEQLEEVECGERLKEEWELYLPDINIKIASKDNVWTALRIYKFALGHQNSTHSI